MFHRVGPAAYKPGLDNTWALLELVGNPQVGLKTAHIAEQVILSSWADGALLPELDFIDGIIIEGGDLAPFDTNDVLA